MHVAISVASSDAPDSTRFVRARSRAIRPPLFTMADPAMQELKRNAMILGAWIAAIRIAPYVCHAVQGALSK